MLFHIMATRSQANKMTQYLRPPLDCGACDKRDDRRVPAIGATKGTKYVHECPEEAPSSFSAKIDSRSTWPTDGRTDGKVD